MKHPRSGLRSAKGPMNGLCHPRGAPGGFTIMEVMMAAAVMAFAITTSITTMQRGFLALDTGRNLTTAGQIMQCELERMRLRDWASISAMPAGKVPIDAAYFNNPAIGNRFTMTRTVDEVHTNNMKKITLKISWRSYDGRPLSRSYTTYYGKNGLYDYYYNTTYPSLY